MNFPTGLNVTETIAIESPRHLGDVLADASEKNQPVFPVGGGTCLGTGSTSEHGFVALDMTRLNGIDNYVPTDMTASFQAGTPLSDVRAALAANGQELPIDLSPGDGGTIGGLVATGYSGARRYGQGTLKDLIIGCEYVRGDGMLAKAGGMTVKNVSGFEISRLLHGSWGSLAVLTRVNLKVLPKARVDRTFAWIDADLQMALDRQLRLLESFPGCIALQTRAADGGFQTAIRFVGREPAVDAYQQELASAEGEPTASFEDDSLWLPESTEQNYPRLVASNPVSESRTLALALSEAQGIDGLSVSLPTGTVSARIDSGAVSLPEIGALATGLWMVEGGEPGWKQDGSVWGPAREDRSVAQSVKQQFDPAGILNRGRLFI